MGHRMSSLPIARFCGLSPEIGKKYGAGRSAAMGTAFHALCSDEEGASKLLACLSEEELAEVTTWHRPESVTQYTEEPLTYEGADKELTVCLDIDGEWCLEDDPRCLTVGHLDYAWHVDGVAYVVDIKRSSWTVAEGVESLQLLAYGVAYASRHECDLFRVGIWAATEGEYHWSKEYNGVLEMADVAERVVAAASNTETTTGPHCKGCYSRLHCPEHLAPAAVGAANPALAMVCEGESRLATHEQAYDALLVVQAMENLCKLAKAHVQEWGRRNGGIKSDGKVYRPVKTKGRARFDQQKFKAEQPETHQRYMTRGAPGESWRWTNE